MHPLRFARFIVGFIVVISGLHERPVAYGSDDGGLLPRSEDGRALNLDFETGTLAGWTAQGEAFTVQPTDGDTVADRRGDSKSGHEGRYWIGGYEKLGDAPQGTLTSDAFRVTAPYCSFLVGGGPAEKARVELRIAETDEPFFIVGGKSSETLAPVLVDLRSVQGKWIKIHLVDASSGGWGHINFDHFRFHAERPDLPLATTTQLLTDDEYPFAGLPAEEAAAAMIVPEGFRVTAMASEPDVKQPIAMAIDDRGRVWIAEAYEYPVRADGEQGRDRILIFEDQDGDGKFDSRKVFYEGLNLVSGMELGFGGVWVGAAPYLMFIPDRDQDDVPDGAPEILLDGWGYQDTHETLNSFIWGPDGWLYGCHGVFTQSRVGKPGTLREDRVRINAGIWRYHPVRHEFEVFAHGTSNPWGVDFNEHGEAFLTACVIPHLFHIIPQGRYHRQAGPHFNRHTYSDIQTIADHLHYLGPTPHGGNSKSDAAGGGHAHSGAMIYQGGRWPSQYHGQLFMNNIHGQRLNVDILTPRGSGYVGSHAPDFLLTRDQASQILNMQYGPDGNVFFIDWYDMQACHLKEIEKHDRSNGRIYKVSYGDLPHQSVDLSKASDLELATTHTLSSNEWYVRHARRLLQERAAQGEVDPSAIEILKSYASTGAKVQDRLRAIWALHVIGAIDQTLHQKILTDSDPNVRSWAIRLFLERAQSELPNVAFDREDPRFPAMLAFQNLRAEQVSHWVAMAKQDKSPIVRLALASAANVLPFELRWDLVSELAAHAEDQDDHNLPLMIWYAMEPLADVEPDRALALGLKASETIPVLGEFMLRRIAGSGDQAVTDYLVQGLEKVDSSDLQLKFLSAIRAALVGKRQAARPSNWDRVSANLRQSKDVRVQREATSLGVVFGDSEAMNAVRQILGDTKASAEDRAASLDALLAAGDPGLPETLVALVQHSTEEPGGLVEQAIRGLAQYDAPTAPQVLLAQYPKLNEAQRRSAIATLSSRKHGAKALLDSIAAGQTSSADLTADFARQIDYLGDPEISEQLARVWGSVRKTSEEKLATITRYQKLVEHADLPKPDLALGRALFAKTCQRCHLLYGVGEKIGPDITGSNRANLDYLLENIVDPSAVMAKEYHQSIILTDSGQVITGIVLSENENAVTMQTAESLVVIPKEEIDSQSESQLSMMPEDQLNQFDEHQIRSLFAYLQHKSQTPMLATADNAQSLFNGKDLQGWHGNNELWSVQNGEIVGRSPGIRRNEFLISDFLVRDFKLSVEVKLDPNRGNSGIQFRSEPTGEGDVKGYQADIGAGWWGKLYEEHGRALLWNKSAEKSVKPGDWNRYEIEAVGSRIRTWINGQLSVELDDPEGSREGILALQIHSGGPMEVRFRNLKLEVR